MNENKLIITFDEIKTIFKKNKKQILALTIGCSLLTIVFALSKPVEYLAEGSFKDKAKSNSGLSSFAGLLSGSSSQENNAIALMKSQTLRENLSKHLSLQADVKRSDSHDYLLKRIWENSFIEIKQFLFPTYLSLKDPEKTIGIRDLIYEGEEPKHLKIHIVDENSWVIEDGSKKISGLFNEPVVQNEYRLTLYTLQEKPKPHETYSLNLKSLAKSARDLSDHLIIEQDRIDKNLLNIKFKDRDRHLAALVVNSLMEIYKEYLKDEQNQMITHQIQYLERRQAEILERLKNSMQNHILKISDDIKNIGFPNTNLAMEFLTGSQNTLQKKLLDIEFELKRLQNSQHAGYAYLDTHLNPLDPGIIHQMMNQIRDLKQQKTSLNLSLKDYQEEIHTTLDGIDPKTTQDLFIAYTHQLNEIESQVLQNKFIIEKMREENFELSSLGTILNDHVSLETSKKATELEMNLKDLNNRSVKEQERIKEDLKLQKRFLSAHLDDANQLLVLNHDLIKRKIKTLQNVTLNGIKQQLSLLEGNLTEYIQDRINNLKAEADIIEQHKLALMNQMSSLPSKWVSEKLIHLEMEVNQKMVEEVSKLVETKNIGSHLELIQSTVIDKARAPIHPLPKRPLLFGFLGGILGALSSMIYFLLRHVKYRS